MDEAIELYHEAVKESIAASKAETHAVLRKKLAREKLYQAKQRLWDMERDLIEQDLIAQSKDPKQLEDDDSADQ